MIRANSDNISPGDLVATAGDSWSGICNGTPFHIVAAKRKSGTSITPGWIDMVPVSFTKSGNRNLGKIKTVEVEKFDMMGLYHLYRK